MKGIGDPQPVGLYTFFRGDPDDAFHGGLFTGQYHLNWSVDIGQRHVAVDMFEDGLRLIPGAPEAYHSPGLIA